MKPQAQTIVAELQAVLTRHHAALFFGPDNEGEIYIEGNCAGHVTHGDNCELVEGSICEIDMSE